MLRDRICEALLLPWSETNNLKESTQAPSISRKVCLRYIPIFTSGDFAMISQMFLGVRQPPEKHRMFLGVINFDHKMRKTQGNKEIAPGKHDPKKLFGGSCDQHQRIKTFPSVASVSKATTATTDHCIYLIYMGYSCIAVQWSLDRYIYVWIIVRSVICCSGIPRAHRVKRNQII